MEAGEYTNTTQLQFGSVIVLALSGQMFSHADLMQTKEKSLCGGDTRRPVRTWISRNNNTHLWKGFEYKFKWWMLWKASINLILFWVKYVVTSHFSSFSSYLTAYPGVKLEWESMYANKNCSISILSKETNRFQDLNSGIFPKTGLVAELVIFLKP